MVTLKMQQNKHRNHRRNTLSVVVLAMTFGNTNGLVTGLKRQRADMSSAVYYKLEGGATIRKTPQKGRMAANIITNPLVLSQESETSKIPPWLKIKRSHLLVKNLSKLEEAMYKSFYTTNEILKLNYAIEEASLGNRCVMSGAAEFCLILAETMEMGLSALIAAAFHYCSCITSHEVSSSMKPYDSTYKSWETLEHKGVHMFGDHVVQITRDAARLKKLEMIFSSIVQNPKNQAGVLGSKVGDNLRLLLLTDTKDWRALAIRSAAYLYRLRSIEKEGNSRLTSEAVQSSREALYIFAPLASRLGMHRLKDELEGAAFRTLHSRPYSAVKSSLSSQLLHRKNSSNTLSVGESMQHVLKSVKQEMKDLFSNDPLFCYTVDDFSITARVKEPYSMWKKMLRQRTSSILEVPDVLALRIILKTKKVTPEESDEVTRMRDRALCYYAQTLCKENWAPLENPRYKDYIENPKPNGYQSLHYTASTTWQEEEWKIEIQIRSEDMHKVAEYGLASHWGYKLNAETKKSANSEVVATQPQDNPSNTLQQEKSVAIQWDASPASTGQGVLLDDAKRKMRADFIRDRRRRLAPYLDALIEAKWDLAQNNVFVFLSPSKDCIEGNIVALPSNACVRDALRESERETGTSPSGTPVLNGSAVSVTQRLRNGDILTMSTENKVMSMSVV